MQNLGDFNEWVDLDTTQQLPFTGFKPREVVLVVNTPETTLLAIEPITADGEVQEPMFLARVVGFDTIRVNVAGPFNLVRMDGGKHIAYIRTSDGSQQHRESIGLEKFTQMHVERKLSPEYQYVLDMVQKNSMRNMAVMAAQNEELRNELLRNRLPSPAPAGAPAPQQTDVAVPPANEGGGDTSADSSGDA